MDFIKLLVLVMKFFMDRIDLKKVILPNTLKFIGKKAFYHCDNLEEIVVGGSIKVIEKEAFGNCLNLKE